MLGRKIKIFIPSLLQKTQDIQGGFFKLFLAHFFSIRQRRLRIFKERRVFFLGRIIKIFISSNLQRRPIIFKEFFMLAIADR